MGYYSSLKYEGNSETRDDMDKSWKRYAEWNKPDTN